ncbi:MAG: glycosyltransferase family 2 protein [Oscillospiraceae bacterium]|nr:glycosyltransferase family 2 protein [Oscillospiraceae bacterium]
MITIIVPCFNEQESLPLFYEEAKKALTSIGQPYEMLFVNDGSRDGTLAVLRNLSEKDDKVRYVSFSRNFGKEAAMYAGFCHAKGDYVTIMDADLQHPPAMLEEMYLAIKDEGYDIVAARRVSRKGEPPIRSFFARCFYRLINKISNAEFVDGASDFRMFSRKAVDAILELQEYNRFSKGVFGWIGFQTKWIPYENVERVAGETSWSFWKLLLYSLEGIIAFSTAPLAIASVIGVIFCLLSFIGLIVIVVKTLIWGDPVAGYPTLACLLLLIGGSIQLSLGIIGQYLAKTYLETKRRPHYIISETNETVNIGGKQV